MNNRPKSYVFWFFPMLILLLGGCSIHDDFEQPDPWNFPEGTILSVSQLREMFIDEPITFTEDYRMYATVTMDDKSGNIYRSAFVQDQSGAINLRLVAPGGLYRGDSVHIHLKGTTLGSYQNMLQLDNVNADRHIRKMAVQKEVKPIPVSVSALRTGNYQGQLIVLDQVQFKMAETGKPFADKDKLLTMNRILEDCDGNSVIVRTSGYANFAGQPVPEGSGSIVAIVSQYQNDTQLYIREIEEVKMTESRCAIPGDEYNLLTIGELRQQFSQGNATVPANSRIEGVVISDREHNNHPGQNLYMTDDSGKGIVVRFSSFHPFDLGTKIRVVFASPMPMSTFRGLLQIDNVPGGNAYDLGPGTLPPPKTITIAEAANNMETYESTLVRFENVTISGGDTFNGNLTITDTSGKMLMYTYSWASFSEDKVPSGNLHITGILSAFDNPQLLIRNLNDITK
jgi:hypothetical protein